MASSDSCGVMASHHSNSEMGFLVFELSCCKLVFGLFATVVCFVSYRCVDLGFWDLPVVFDIGVCCLLLFGDPCLMGTAV